MTPMNGWFTKTVCGFILTAIITALSFMGGKVYENRETEVKEHRDMQKEYLGIKESVIEINTRQQEIVIPTLLEIKRKL